MNNDVFDEIKRFVIEKRGRFKKGLTRETQLEGDLKITGDDSDEFFKDFSERFEVDIDNLDLSQYFAPEGSFSLYRLLFFGKNSKRKIITLGDLEKGVIDGKL
jgi:hypothetical protein